MTQENNPLTIAETNDNSATSTQTIKHDRNEVLQRIKVMIDKEDKHNPLGDMEIYNRLKAVGYEIERRTVAKYRGDLLGYPNSNDRREK